MKRKRSQDLEAACPSPKFAKHGASRQPQASEKSGSEPCSLLRIIEQYGLLVSIVSNLTPEDLFALAAASKAIYKAMFSGEASMPNILRKMPCAGRGLQIRHINHVRSPVTLRPRCLGFDVCGAMMGNIETHPCVRCKLNTCDECRIHCVFNSTFEPEEEPDELPTYSGFVLLSPHDMGILTPAHLKLPGENPTTMAPYHDKGFLDSPWIATDFVNPESIAEILDFDLARGPLRLANDSNARHPSSIIKAFWHYTEQRKMKMCDDCREVQQVGDFHPQQHKCACTLRKHVLGQWTCVGCFQKECLGICGITRAQFCFKYPELAAGFGVGSSSYLRCTCGKILDGQNRKGFGRQVCLWCNGLLAHEEGVDDSEPPSAEE
ncbi:hypothetical protein PMIN03_007618 [Paraphaeosphaeria minitans]